MMNLVGYERNQLTLILNYKNLSQDLNYTEVWLTINLWNTQHQF